MLNEILWKKPHYLHKVSLMNVLELARLRQILSTPTGLMATLHESRTGKLVECSAPIEQCWRVCLALRRQEEEVCSLLVAHSWLGEHWSTLGLLQIGVAVPSILEQWAVRGNRSWQEGTAPGRPWAGSLAGMAAGVGSPWVGSLVGTARIVGMNKRHQGKNRAVGSHPEADNPQGGTPVDRELYA